MYNLKVFFQFIGSYILEDVSLDFEREVEFEYIGGGKIFYLEEML